MQILNLSVYGRDCTEDVAANKIGESNQIDSLTEYIAEIVLEHKDAFPENGTHNRHSNSLPHFMKHINLKIISFRKNPVSPYYSSSQPIAIPSKEEYKNMFSMEIIPPPPKA